MYRSRNDCLRPHPHQLLQGGNPLAQDGRLLIKSLRIPILLQIQGLLRQALAMLTRRSKKATLPHVVVKYSRRDKQHVAKVIVTESAYPVICPHGFDRDLNEYCAVRTARCIAIMTGQHCSELIHAGMRTDRSPSRRSAKGRNRASTRRQRRLRTALTPATASRTLFAQIRSILQIRTM